MSAHVPFVVPFIVRMNKHVAVDGNTFDFLDIGRKDNLNIRAVQQSPQIADPGVSLSFPDRVDFEGVIPGRIKGDAGCFDGTGGIFQRPVSAQSRGARQVRRGGDIRARRIRNALQEGLSRIRGSRFTAVDHHVAVVGDVSAENFKSGNIRHIIGTENQTAVIAVSQDVDCVVLFVAVRFQVCGNLFHRAVLRIGVENQDVAGIAELIQHIVQVRGGGVDDHQFIAFFRGVFQQFAGNGIRFIRERCAVHGDIGVAVREDHHILIRAGEFRAEIRQRNVFHLSIFRQMPLNIADVVGVHGIGNQFHGIETLAVMFVQPVFDLVGGVGFAVQDKHIFAFEFRRVKFRGGVLVQDDEFGFFRFGQRPGGESGPGSIGHIGGQEIGDFAGEGSFGIGQLRETGTALDESVRGVGTCAVRLRQTFAGIADIGIGGRSFRGTGIADRILNELIFFFRGIAVRLIRMVCGSGVIDCGNNIRRGGAFEQNAFFQLEDLYFLFLRHDFLRSWFYLMIFQLVFTSKPQRRNRGGHRKRNLPETEHLFLLSRCHFSGKQLQSVPYTGRPVDYYIRADAKCKKNIAPSSTFF